MTGDDGLLLWQRIALERGDPIDVPPRQHRAAVKALVPVTGDNQMISKPGLDLEQPPDGYRIDLPWERPPINHNQRLTPWALGAVKAEVRKAVKLLAMQAKIPHHEYITVQLHYAPGRRGRRDPMNLTATSKPAIDGLVDAKIVDDDDSEHLHELPPEIHFPPVPGPRCWLIITPGKADQP